MSSLKGKTLGVFHASHITIAPIEQFAGRYIPEVTLMHICDDTVQRDNLNAPVGKIPKINFYKFAQYCHNFEMAGVDAVLLACSTFNQAVEIAQPVVNIPLIQIDRAMMDIAVQKGNRVGLLATLPSTVPSSTRLLKKAAEDAGKKIEIEAVLCKEAFIQLTEHKNTEKHNEILLNAIEELSKKVDCIVMAQLSMSALVPMLKDTKVPVYTSGDTGILRVKEILENL